MSYNMNISILSLKWNSHERNLVKSLSKFREQTTYSDVTIACGERFFQAHRVVLSAGSGYFERIFNTTHCKCPVIVLKDIHPTFMKLILDYMYLGSIEVRHEDLGNLMKVASFLKVKGLSLDGESFPVVSLNKGLSVDECFPEATDSFNETSDIVYSLDEENVSKVIDSNSKGIDDVNLIDSENITELRESNRKRSNKRQGKSFQETKENKKKRSNKEISPDDNSFPEVTDCNERSEYPSPLCKIRNRDIQSSIPLVVVNKSELEKSFIDIEFDEIKVECPNSDGNIDMSEVYDNICDKLQSNDVIIGSNEPDLNEVENHNVTDIRQPLTGLDSNQESLEPYIVPTNSKTSEPHIESVNEKIPIVLSLSKQQNSVGNNVRSPSKTDPLNNRVTSNVSVKLQRLHNEIELEQLRMSTIPKMKNRTLYLKENSAVNKQRHPSVSTVVKKKNKEVYNLKEIKLKIKKLPNRQLKRLAQANVTNRIKKHATRSSTDPKRKCKEYAFEIPNEFLFDPVQKDIIISSKDADIQDSSELNKEKETDSIKSKEKICSNELTGIKNIDKNNLKQSSKKDVESECSERKSKDLEVLKETRTSQKSENSSYDGRLKKMKKTIWNTRFDNMDSHSFQCLLCPNYYSNSLALLLHCRTHSKELSN